MSPAYQGIVYGQPTEIQADVIKGNYTHKEVMEDQKVKVYGGKMEWMGETFLTCGTLLFHYLLLNDIKLLLSNIYYIIIIIIYDCYNLIHISVIIIII